MKLAIIPHNDDESLFLAFTLLREKPLVVIVTDSFIQFNRGDGITADQRWEETVKAMQVLGCPVMRLGIRDDVIDEWAVKDKLSRFSGFDEVYAPAIQGGNKDHDLIGRVVKEMDWDKRIVEYYATYSATELYTTGEREIVPTQEELDLKNRALVCYKSQINLPSTKPHYEAVKGKSEWFI